MTQRHAPQRIQLRRTKAWRIPNGAVVVARPSRWGNPFQVGSEGVAYQGVMLGSGAGRYDRSDPRSCDLLLPGPHARLTDAQAVALYRDDLVASLAEDGPYGDELREALKALRGKDLACWCPLQDEHGKRAPCHADVLLAAANRRWPATQ
jgi:hypothetical protein